MNLIKALKAAAKASKKYTDDKIIESLYSYYGDFNITMESGTIHYQTGLDIYSSAFIRSVGYLNIGNLDGSLILTPLDDNYRVWIYRYDPNKTYVLRYSLAPGLETEIKLRDDQQYIRISIEALNGATAPDTSSGYSKYFTAEYKCVAIQRYMTPSDFESGVAKFRIIDKMMLDGCTETPMSPVGLSGDRVVQFTTSVFSGWKADGLKFNADISFRSITFPVRARGIAITKVMVEIHAADDDVSRIIDVDIPPNTTANITFNFDTPISVEAGSPISVGYACDQFCDLVAKNTTETIHVYYASNGTLTGRWGESTVHKFVPDFIFNALSFSGQEVDIESLKKEIIDEIQNQAGEIRLVLPEKFDLVVGDNFELFYKGILNAIDPSRYDYEISFDTGNHGLNFRRKFTWNPTNSDIGQHTMTISVRSDDGKIVDTGYVILNVVGRPTSPTSNKVVLCVGDSLTENGYWCSEFLRRLITSDGEPSGYALNNIQFIGDRIRDGAAYVGNGGWTFSSYNTENRNGRVYWIHGQFAKTIDDQHAVYADNSGNTWKLETITETAIKIILVSGTAFSLPVSGVLSHVSGGVNTDDITYTNRDVAAGNPFWNPSKSAVDFTWYAEQNGVSRIDYCEVLLGWNSTGASEDEYKAQVRVFIDNLLTAFPDCKISLMGLQVPSRDGIGQNYGVSWKYYDKLQSVWNISKWYTEIAREESYIGKVDHVNISGQFDTDYNMPYNTFAVNNRNTTKETRQTNGVHPALNGYLQIADAILRSFVAKIN